MPTMDPFDLSSDVALRDTVGMEMRDQAYKWCQQHMGGTWSHVDCQQFNIQQLMYVESITINLIIINIVLLSLIFSPSRQNMISFILSCGLKDKI